MWAKETMMRKRTDANFRSIDDFHDEDESCIQNKIVSIMEQRNTIYIKHAIIFK